MIVGMVVMAGLSMTGCTLIDRSTFAPAPEAKPAQPAVVAQIDARHPLVTIGYEQPNPQYQEMLGYAVHVAEARSSAAVQYDVFAVVAPKGAPADRINDAVGVMKAIMALGVPAERIHLGVRSDPAITANEVRVYVR
jgi:hypothetical protein